MLRLKYFQSVAYLQMLSQPKMNSLVYLAAITLAETITVVIDPLWGIISHILVLGALISHSALAREPTHQRLLLALSLAPLVRIVSLSMPLVNIPQVWWYPIIYVPLLVGAVVVTRTLNISAGEIGLVLRRFRIQLVIAFSGLIIGVAEYFILHPEPMLAELTWQALWLPALILLLTTGFVEEFIFRGVLQRTAGELFSSGQGIVYVSALFAILHMGYLSLIDVVFVFAVALFFGWIVKKTGSLLGVTLAHGLANIMLLLVVPSFF